MYAVLPALRSSHITFRYNLAVRLCEYEKHQQKYFNCLRYEARGSCNSNAESRQNMRFCYLHKRSLRIRFTSGSLYYSFHEPHMTTAYQIAQ